MILPVDVRLCDGKNVIKEQFTEILEMMTFPVVNASRQAFDSLFVLGAALRFVDLVSDSLGGV